MSSSKRRKLDEPETGSQPSASAVSAVSALAARRRLAAVASVESSQPSSPSRGDTSVNSRSSSNANAFSVLQNLSRQGNSESQSASQASTPQDLKKSGRSTPLKRSEAARGSEVAVASPSRSIQYSSFRETTQNHRTTSKGVVQLRLKESERFMVLGSFGIVLIEGELTIAGATLRPSPDLQWIHAPHCHAIPVLRTTKPTKLELHADPAAKSLRQLGRLSPLFRRIWNDPVEAPGAQRPPSTFRILYSSEDAPKKSIIQDLVSPPAWNKKLAASLASHADQTSYTTLVCGPKSTGKSTFSRLLTNRLLTRSSRSVPSGVAILDLDPGQPEYAVPGTLSLVHVTKPNLSAPFSHSCFENEGAKVIRCHALAAVSPASDPDLYRECAFNLHDEYLSKLQNLPLIINTPGWVLGTGLQLLEDIIKRTSPSEVIYMSEEGPAEAVDALEAVASDSLRTLPSQPSEFATRTAAHLRAMQTMTYFHLRSHTASLSGGRLQWNPSPLSAIPPWQVAYAGPGSGIMAVMSYDYQSPADLLAETINGTVLAAVEIEDAKAFRDLNEEDSSMPRISRTPEDLPFIANPNDVALDPRHSHTIGLVLIRGIDTATRSIQILTPIPPQTIEQVKARGNQIVFVHGKFDAPGWAYTEDLYLRSGDDDTVMDQTMKVEDQDTSEDDSDAEGLDSVSTRDVTNTPWVETLRGNEKRPVGSKVWRVRRDLGRSAGDG
ncbi:unnamed protein product [Clonostachys rhizophaga]|uniref:Polynucleotide 5'-hydroxyl-kinase GRC3 n=1 Tax=Clonostachys rhizophaga TaxID=160324 RepID=A0A9N9YHK9_9HYPO|nr:unnamed protein product [Clonostachys rhizophaga]